MQWDEGAIENAWRCRESGLQSKFYEVAVTGVKVNMRTSKMDIPAVPIQYQKFRWHYVKGYLYKKEGRSASPYYLWRTQRLYGQVAIDAYHAGRKAFKVLRLVNEEAA